MAKYTVKFHYKGKSASMVVSVNARSEHDAREQIRATYGQSNPPIIISVRKGLLLVKFASLKLYVLYRG